MILKGRAENDQSYMLCRLERAQAARLTMPLGPYNKEEVRALAERFELPVAHKAASMEICFIPDKDYVGWISARGVTLPPPGDFVFHGAVVGHFRNGPYDLNDVRIDDASLLSRKEEIIAAVQTVNFGALPQRFMGEKP